MNHANAEAWKKRAWDDIDHRREELLNLLGEVIRRPSDNPPGDTTELANFMKQVLEDSGIPVQVYEPKQANPNIVASVAQNGGRHLVLNGHLDQFPVERPDTWTGNPYSGEVRGGRIFGRGAADMKGGTTALLAASLVLKQIEVPLAGKLTLTLVSDEETGGRWGTEWLLENQPHLVGDAVLNAEPSSTEAIYVAEKGVCWLKVSTHSEGGHSGLSPLNNAIFKMSTAIQLGLKLRGKKGDVPHELTGILAKSRELLESLPSGKGNGWVYDSVTLNVGTIKGGVKANVVPAECEAEFDFRLPLGITPEHLIGEFRELLTKEGLGEEDITIEPLYTCPPSHTSPDAEIIRTVMQNAEAVTGKLPRLHFMYGGSDCRFWRYKSIPAAIFGPKSYNMAASDEHIEVEDYFKVMKVHAGSIIDYLGVTS